MTGEDVKQDATLTFNWLRINFPTIAAVVSVGIVLGTLQTQIQTSIEGLRSENAAIKVQLAELQNAPYRIDRLEEGLRDSNTRVDHLSNTIISQMDLIRRDVNRLTTQVEVLSSRVGLLTGEIDEPRRRISRPPPATDQP